MEVTSTAFGNEEEIPDKYTCGGENINPPLKITDIPGEAVSLALICDDPDAPGGTFVHWLLWDFKPVQELMEDSVPENAVQGATSYRVNHYKGPCPPSGVHRYYFKIYALDTTLGLQESAGKQDLLEAMDGHILDSAVLMGTYTRD